MENVTRKISLIMSFLITMRVLIFLCEDDCLLECCITETPVTFYQTAWCNIQEDSRLRTWNLTLFFFVCTEVDIDVNRTWCPRAGCETVCNVCGPVERCLPRSVHCPTCSSDFCSNCKNPWHLGFSCEENTRRLAKEGHTDLMESGIPFDSDLIKCCPMCNVPIEKDDGCAQMMCKRCKHVFCWYCLASLDVSPV